MKSLKYFLLFTILMCLFSCTTQQKITDTGHDKEPAHIITAAFKNTKKIDENNWMLIFRRADNCQYILFSLNKDLLQTIPYTFIRGINEEPEINNDYLNLMFNIKYTGDTSYISEAEEVIIYPEKITMEKTRSDRFVTAGFNDDSEAENFIIELKDLARNNEAEKIADLISYPITVSIKKRNVKIKNKNEFIKNYKAIFNKKVTNLLLQQPLADVQSSQKGLILGNGEIRISRVNNRIMITSINNS